MRLIQKGTEPALLRAYRAVPGAAYDGKDFAAVKNEIRDSLLRDQFHLCCYCLRRISKGLRPHTAKPDAPAIVRMKVEHWQSQHTHPHLQLTWPNLLGACLGGEGFPRSAQTCDTRKGESTITLNPLDSAHMETLFCTSDGRLASTNKAFQEDIDERLGLNHAILVGDRRAILDRALSRLKARYPKSEIPIGIIKKLIAEQETPKPRQPDEYKLDEQETPKQRKPDEYKLDEHCNVLRLWARKRYGSLE